MNLATISIPCVYASQLAEGKMRKGRMFRKAIGGTAALAILTILVSCRVSPEVERPSPNTWAAERALREQRQADYLNDATVRRIATDAPTRAPWYSNRLGHAWFTDYPLGVNGVPFVLLRAVIEVYPEIWKGEGSLGNLGFGPHPDDYDPATGGLLPLEQRHPLPFGLVMTQDPALPEEQRTDNVFFSCAACHTARVYVNGRVRHFVGGPNSEVEAQAYAGLLYRTGQALMKGGGSELAPEQVDPAQVGKIVGFLKTKVATDPGWFYGGRTVAERADNAARAEIQVARLLANPQAMVAALLGPAKKTELMYIKLASQLSYTEKDGQKAPGVFGPRPGRMDAFGLSAGLV